MFHNLTSFQQWEIEKYDIKKLYYIGNRLDEAHITDFEAYSNSFRNTDGTYLVVIGDQLMYRFQILNVLGRGGNALIIHCMDHKQKREVAIKITSIFKSDDEANILKHIHDNSTTSHENIISIYETFKFRNFNFLVMELLVNDLQQYVFMKGSGLPEKEVKSITTALLKALNYVHKASIVHADLKPENVMLDNVGNIKLIDFGHADFEKKLVGQILQTKRYRAPETFLGHSLTCAIDLWSLGCVVHELFTGCPLFSSLDVDAAEIKDIVAVEKPQSFEELRRLLDSERLGGSAIPRICDVIGAPSPDLVKCWRKTSPTIQRYFSEDGFPTYQPGPNGNFIDKLLEINTHGQATFELINFIKKCLEWDPLKRISTEDAQNHRWITSKDNIASYPKITLPRLLEAHSLSYLHENFKHSKKSRLKLASTTSHEVVNYRRRYL